MRSLLLPALPAVLALLACSGLASQMRGVQLVELAVALDPVADGPQKQQVMALIEDDVDEKECRQGLSEIDTDGDGAIELDGLEAWGTNDSDRIIPTHVERPYGSVAPGADPRGRASCRRL